jgi:hypothetical protein
LIRIFYVAGGNKSIGLDYFLGSYLLFWIWNVLSRLVNVGILTVEKRDVLLKVEFTFFLTSFSFTFFYMFDINPVEVNEELIFGKSTLGKILNPKDFLFS